MKGLACLGGGFVLLLAAEGGLVCETLRLGTGIVLMTLGAAIMAVGVQIGGHNVHL